MSILGLSNDKHNVAGLGAVKFLLFVMINLVQVITMKLKSQKTS